MYSALLIKHADSSRIIVQFWKNSSNEPTAVIFQGY